MPDTEGFEEFYTATVGRLLGAMYPVTGDLHEAEEIVQEAFERCFLRWGRVSKLDRPGAWVRRVAINGAISAGRRTSSEHRAVQRFGALATTSAGSAADPLTALADEDLWAEVRALPKDQAAAIALRYGADLGVTEIAETLRLTVPAVKSLLHRGRAALRSSPAFLLHAQGADPS